ncbi:YkuS family protein [Clostridium ganghwense]|uniref:YkuS family protein n=1 Tax=Clostridium ganghwense TaxID=312089 RepID=A0ABT4CLQ3_9CLOT|nr:YkuS family protein [Clostridium ganghwense]MCY6369980.1 YkuS family protein [Clostridium ganghwense]
MHYIAVEKGLDNVTDYLIQQGYNIEEFYEGMKSNPEYFNKFDAVVSSDLDRNILQITDERTTASGINAGILGTQEGLSSVSAINTGLVNENNIGLQEDFTSVPIVSANAMTPEQIQEKIDNLK